MHPIVSTVCGLYHKAICNFLNSTNFLFQGEKTSNNKNKYNTTSTTNISRHETPTSPHTKPENPFWNSVIFRMFIILSVFLSSLDVMYHLVLVCVKGFALIHQVVLALDAALKALFVSLALVTFTVFISIFSILIGGYIMADVPAEMEEINIQTTSPYIAMFTSPPTTMIERSVREAPQSAPSMRLRFD